MNSMENLQGLIAKMDLIIEGVDTQTVEEAEQLDELDLNDDARKADKALRLVKQLEDRVSQIERKLQPSQVPVQRV